jgi:hypothetical protein
MSNVIRDAHRVRRDAVHSREAMDLIDAGRCTQLHRVQIIDMRGPWQGAVPAGFSRRTGAIIEAAVL